MANTLYLECYSGISGDMLVAALLDLGADVDELKRALDSLSVSGFQIEISRVKKAGLDVCDFHVKLDDVHENHDHDMEYLHGHEKGHHYHDHEMGYLHGHEEEHHHENSHHVHEHRGLPEILEILNRAELSNRAKEIAVKIFTIIAQAEAKAHGVEVDKVHFHEVGAVDSIVDIVAAAVCLDNLGIAEVIVPYLCEGVGTVRCQHGILPIPVPAVVNIIKEENIRLQITNVEGELVTPTGAAIVAAIRTSDELPEQFEIKKIGVGAGKRNYEKPSLLRAMLIKKVEKKQQEKDVIYKLETNIDDCTGETLGFVMDKLFTAGAREVHYLPVFMKKNRPAYQLNVICDDEHIDCLEQIIFKETTTIGIRRTAMERTILKREMTTIQTIYGEVQVKQCTLPDGEIRCYPEYESAVKLSEETGVSFQQIMDAVKR